MLYFAYGSNMSSARLVQRVGDVGVRGRARLDAHRHRFSKLGNDGTGKGNIESWGDELVWGVVYELDARQFASLIGFEDGYHSLELDVTIERGARAGARAGERLRAHSFQALRALDGLSPTAAYLEHYCAGMREHQLPDDYCVQVLGSLWSR